MRTTQWITATLVLPFLLTVSTAYSQTALYGASSGAGSLYLINTSNGGGTLVAALSDSSNQLFGIRSLAGDPTGQLWGTTSDDSPTAPDSLVRIDAGNAVVTVVGPLNAPSGGGANGIGFLPDGTLLGWFPAASVYGTIDTFTGQVTTLSAPQATAIGGLAVSKTFLLMGPNTYASGAVVSVTATSQSPDAALRSFSRVTNTDSRVVSVIGAPCCTFTALVVSSPFTMYAIAGGSLVSIQFFGAATTLGAVPSGVVALAFATTPPALPAP